MTRSVRAYHGTTYTNAVEIYNHRSPFQHSNWDGNWLGKGVYFFEENLVKAIEWAFEQVNVRSRLGFFDSAAVLAADIDLSDCLDLSSSLWHDELRTIADSLDRAKALPQQHGPVLSTPGNATGAPMSFTIADYPMPSHNATDHRADKQVIDALIADLHQNKFVINAIRASFPVGIQPFSNSHFFSDTHTQIVVLDPAAIVKLDSIIHPLPMPATMRGRNTARKLP